MKEYKKTQYGYSVVEYYPDNKLYSIKSNHKESVHHLVPEEIWDSLASAVERAETYRKSRDHFRESRDLEKSKSAETIEKLMDSQKRLYTDIDRENQYLMDELHSVEYDLKIYKTVAAFLGIFCALCLLTHYLI
jgi:hypothetical protein